MTVSVSIARRQFKNSGLIRHDLLRKQIIASWERSRIYGIDEESLMCDADITNDTSGDIVSPVPPSQGMLCIVDENGLILTRIGKLAGLNGLENVSENVIGTSAFCLCSSNGKYEKVEFDEHFIEMLSPYVSECYKASKDRYVLLFSELEIGSKRLNELGELYLNADDNRFKLRFTRVDAPAKTHACMAGISREICNARDSIAEYSNNKKGTIALCAASEFLLNSMTGLLNAHLSEDGIIQVWNEKELKEINHGMLNDKIIMYVDVHRYSFKSQMLLFRMLQDSNYKKNKGYIWGFTSTDGIDMSSMMVTGGLLGYMNCPRIILHDIDRRRMDIPFICRVLYDSMGQSYRLSQAFTDQLIGMENLVRTEDLLAYLEFLNATIPLGMPLKDDNKTDSFRKNPKTLASENVEKTASIKVSMASGMASYTKVDMKTIERDAIIRALENNNHILKNTATELGIGRTTLYRKMKAYSIESR